MILAGLCMPHLGQNGDVATEEEIADNVHKAKEIGDHIQRHFPESLKLYIPHTDPALQQEHIRVDGIIQGSDAMMEQYCKIVSDMQLLIVVGVPDETMLSQIERANDEDIAVLIIDEWDESVIGQIAWEILDI